MTALQDFRGRHGGSKEENNSNNITNNNSSLAYKTNQLKAKLHNLCA
jgi:hypothetical protein